jgi:hypothetical protein
MQLSPTNEPGNTEDSKFPPAPSGNASNPSPQQDVPAGNNQLLDEKAEKYLRESASIEDLPDEQDWEEANKIIEKEKKAGNT